MLETSELTPSERELCAKAAEGRLLDLRCGRATDDAPASDGRWGSERQVRAQVLVQLLTGQGPELAASVGAVRLRGAAIGGRLNLGGLTLRCPLETASHPACGAHRDRPAAPGGASRDRPPSRR